MNDLCELDSDHSHSLLNRNVLVPVINISPLHIQSTHGDTLTITQAVKERNNKKGTCAVNLYITDCTDRLCFTAISHQLEHESDSGGVMEGQEGEDFWKTLSHSLEWWHGSNETEERDTVL